MTYIEEAIGPPPGNMQEVEYIHLLRVDGHSTTSAIYRDSPLEANSDMTPGYSMERWIRICIESPFETISNVRFWIPGLTLGIGWTLRYGIHETYCQPTSSESVYMVYTIPSERPVVPNILDDEIDGPGPWTSPWIVIQASVDGDAAPGPIMGFDVDTGLPISLEYILEWEQV
jgi:hypothetical protein